MQYKILTEYGMFNMKTKHKNEYVIKEKFCERFFEKYRTNPNYIQIVESVKGQLTEEDKLVYELVDSCRLVTQTRPGYNFNFAHIQNVELKLGNGWPMLKIASSADMDGKKGKSFITIFMPTSDDEYVYDEQDNSITLTRKSNKININYGTYDFGGVQYQNRNRKDITFAAPTLEPQRIKEIISILSGNKEIEQEKRIKSKEEISQSMEFVTEGDIVLNEKSFESVKNNPQLLKVIEGVKSTVKKKTEIIKFNDRLYDAMDNYENYADSIINNTFMVKALRNGKFDDGSSFKKITFKSYEGELLKLYLTTKVKMERFTDLGYDILKVTYREPKPSGSYNKSNTWYFLKGKS